MLAERLTGKVAIVTGGGTGIGAGIAQRFAAEGANVVISGRREELLDETVRVIEAAGGKCVRVPGDTATEQGVTELFSAAERAFASVDVLVNNAAIAGAVAPIWEQNLPDWEEALRINLTGPWLCSRAAANAMMPKGWGRIINIGSISGKRPLAKRTPYTSTKLGLVGLTKTLALELGDYNIAVNCISPGAVETPRLKELAEKGGIPYEQLLEGAAAGTALKRISQPEDIASLAAFLASDESRNVTGIDITVDAGVWYS